MLVAHVKTIALINFRDQRAEDDRAASISGPYQVAFVAVVKDGRGTDFSVIRIAYRNKAAIVVIDSIFHQILRTATDWSNQRRDFWYCLQT